MTHVMNTCSFGHQRGQLLQTFDVVVKCIDFFLEPCVPGEQTLGSSFVFTVIIAAHQRHLLLNPGFSLVCVGIILQRYGRADQLFKCIRLILFAKKQVSGFSVHYNVKNKELPSTQHFRHFKGFSSLLTFGEVWLLPRCVVDQRSLTRGGLQTQEVTPLPGEIRAHHRDVFSAASSTRAASYACLVTHQPVHWYPGQMGDPAPTAALRPYRWFQRRAAEPAALVPYPGASSANCCTGSNLCPPTSKWDKRGLFYYGFTIVTGTSFALFFCRKKPSKYNVISDVFSSVIVY